MPRKPKDVYVTEKDRQIAKELMEGKPILEVMVGHGYHESYARKGRAALTKGIKLALLEQGTKYEWMGQQLLENPQLIESSVVGFLYESMMKRTNKGTTAAKLLGQHRRVDMFASDAQQNVLVIQAPVDWKAPGQRYEPKEETPALPPAETDLPEYE